MRNLARLASAGSLNSQKDNKRAAFKRMASTQRFKDWHRLETARRMQQAHTIESMINSAVDKAMEPHNIKVEVKDQEGRWVMESPDQSG